MALKQEPPDYEPELSPGHQLTSTFESVWVKQEEDDVGARNSVICLPGTDHEQPKPNSGQTNKAPKKPLKQRKRPVPTTVLNCPQCSFTTVYGNSLKFHIMTHSDEKPFSCNLCDFATKFEQALTRHKKFKHGETNTKPKIFKCEQCEYTTIYKANLQKHERKHMPEKEFKCPVSGCAYETAYKHHLLKHNRVHHEKPKGKEDWYQCDKCPYRAQFHGHITRHLEKIHNEVVEGAKYVCEFCQASSKDKWKLKVHKQRSIMLSPVRCIYCSFETIYKCQMQKHKKIHLNELGLAQGTIFTELPMQLSESGERSSEMTPTKANYSESIGNVSVGVEDGVFKCNKCPFKTVYEADMPNHFVESHNACRMCNFCFKDEFYLKTHEMKSKSEYPVKCTVCDFESIYKCMVRAHTNTHYSEICGTTNGNRNFQEELQNFVANRVGEGQKPEFEQGSCMIQPSEAPKDMLAPNAVPSMSLPIGQPVPNNRWPMNSIPTSHHLGPVLPPVLPPVVPQTNKLVENKSGKYLIDQSCIDWQTIQVHESHGDIRRFKCPLCDYASKFKASVQRHFQRHHTGSSNRPYKCMNCDLSVKTKDAISKHNSRSLLNKPLSCKLCNFTTNFKCTYTMHLKLHYTYKCNVCNFNYRTKYDLIRHVDEKHLKQGLKCRFCEFTASRKESLICHETVHTGLKPFKCSACGYSSLRRSLMEAHIVKYHRNDPSAVCETLVSKSAIDSFKAQTKSSGPVEDDLTQPDVDVDVPTETQTDQTNNQEETAVVSDDEVVEVLEEPTLQFDHDAPEQIEVKCNPNDQTVYGEPSCYEDNDYLDSKWDDGDEKNTIKQEDEVAEIKIVTLRLTCDQCEYTTSNHTKLTSHIKRKHSVNKRYKCLKCPFTTSHRLKFIKHSEKHKKVKIFKCKKCSFKTKSQMRMKTHRKTAHLKCECEHCGTVIRDMHLLKQHQKTSVCKNPVKCSLCEFATFYKCELRKHKQTHLTEIHSIKVEDTKKDVKVESDPDDSDNDSANCDDDVLMCDKCTFKTNSSKQLSKHIVEEHNGCKHCDRSFDSELGFKDHIKENKTENVDVCPFCDFDSRYKCEIRKHMCTHFSEYFEPGEMGSLEDRIVTALESIEASEDANEGKHESGTKVKDENKLEVKVVPDGHRLRRNKFGPYLVDTNCVDLKVFRVSRSEDRSRPFKCPACLFTTKFSNSIKRHIQRNHFDETYRPYKCIDCDFATTTTDAIARHNQRKRSNVTLHCNSCKFKSKNRCSMNLHQRQHYMFKCRCNKSFERNGSLISHFATTHLGRRFKCKFCDFVAMTRETVAYHETKHTGIKLYLCNICGHKSTRRNMLEAHFKKHHSGEPQCGVKIEIEEALDDSYYKNEDNTGPVICDDCGYTADDKLTLVGHIRRKHSQSFMCDECGFTTTYKGSLKTHSLTHKHTSVFKCRKCPFETSYKGHMIRHIQSLHSNIVENKITRDVCDYCNQKQKSYYLRKKHQEENRSEKILTCALCEFETYYHCQIEIHVQSHDEKNVPIETAAEAALYTEEKNDDELLKCRYCDFIASKKELLRCHEAAHTGEKPFKCNLCEYAATTRALLFAHWKKYHGPGITVPRRKNKRRTKSKLACEVTD